MITTRRLNLAGERGSIPMVLLAVMVVGTLSAGLLATATAGTQQTRFDRDFTTVVQTADSGAQVVVDQIARGQISDAESGVPRSVTVAGETSTVTPVRVSPLAWLVTGTATRNGISRSVEVQVTDESRFWVAAFADQTMRLTGGNGSDSYGETWDTGNGIIGTNGSVALNGSSTEVDGVHLYNWDAYPDLNRCTHVGGYDCDDVRAQPEAIAPSARVGPRRTDSPGGGLDSAFITEQLAACEASEPLASYTTSMDGAVLGGTGITTVKCVDNLTIDTDFTVFGTVKLYVRGTISIGNGVLVNCPGGCVAGATQPDAAALQIYSAGSSVVVGNHAKVAAAIYAPLATCVGNPSNAQAEFFGSLICAKIANQGGWNFHYDDRLGEIGTGHFRSSSWREE